jgi:hypothetical protein
MDERRRIVNQMAKRQLAVSLLAVAGMLALAGCATVPRDESAALFKAASELESKALGTIMFIESEAAATDIRRVVHSEETILSEEYFPRAITAKSKAALLQHLRGVTAYTRVLSLVGSGDYRGEFSEAVVEAKKAFESSAASANELKKLASEKDLENLKENAGLLAGAVATIGELVIDIRTQEKTIKVAEKIDKYFSAYMQGLADVFAASSNIGDVKESGDQSGSEDKGLTDVIPGEVKGSGDQSSRRYKGLATAIAGEGQWRKKHIIKEYVNLGTQPEDLSKREKWLAQRTELAREFVDAIRGGERSVALAIALRDACLSLGKAHTDLATNRRTDIIRDLGTAIGRIEYLAQVFKETTSAGEE